MVNSRLFVGGVALGRISSAIVPYLFEGAVNDTSGATYSVPSESTGEFDVDFFAARVAVYNVDSAILKLTGLR